MKIALIVIGFIVVLILTALLCAIKISGQYDDEKK